MPEHSSSAPALRPRILQVRNDAIHPQFQLLSEIIEKSVAHLQVKSSPARRSAARGAIRAFVGDGREHGALLMLLEAAYRAKFMGADVVLGYVSPLLIPQKLDERSERGRKIDYLRRGFEQLAAPSSSAPSRIRGWFNASAAVARAPQIVLLDAPIHVADISKLHSNSKLEIWRRAEEVDVMELLLAGINVWTAVHLEPLPLL